LNTHLTDYDSFNNSYYNFFFYQRNHAYRLFTGHIGRIRPYALFPEPVVMAFTQSQSCTGKIPDPPGTTQPTHPFQDEAGILLKQLQQTLEQQNQLLDEKKDIIQLLSHNVQLPFEQFSQLSTHVIQETDLEKLHDHGRTIKEIAVKNLLTLHQILSYLNSIKY